MDIIDEKGRVFGVINLVDFLVVLFILAIAIAGVTAVLDEQNPPSKPEQTHYATLSFSAPLESNVTQIETGEPILPTPAGTPITATDIYRAFERDGDVHFVVRGSYDGRLTRTRDRLYGGDTIPVVVGKYRVEAAVLSINQTNASIETRTVPLVLAFNASAPVKRSLNAGQKIRADNQTVATIRSIDIRQSSQEGPSFIGVELRARGVNGIPMYAGHPLRLNTSVTLVTDKARVTGRVWELGTTEIDDG